MKRSAQCRHTHARYLRRRGETTDIVLGCYLAVLSTPNFGYSTLDTILSATCAKCDAQLAIGKSNDNPAAVRHEMREAKLAKHDDDWIDGLEWEMSGSFGWDITRPLASQWPWNGLASTPSDLDVLTASAKAEQFAKLTGPTDHGQPILDGGMTGYIDQGQLDRLTAMCTPVKTLPLRVVLDGGEPFDMGDHAATQMTDDELVETVAYAPPGSVRDEGGGL